MSDKIIKTLQVRVKDKHAPLLRKMARDVNTIWNFCAETSQKAIRDRHVFLSGFDLQKLVRDVNAALNIRRRGLATLEEGTAS